MTDTEVLNALRILAENGTVNISSPNIISPTYVIRVSSKFGVNDIRGVGDTIPEAICNALVSRTAARLAGGDDDQEPDLSHLDALSKVSQPHTLIGTLPTKHTLFDSEDL
jgi:2-iminoacetate synthase ThiH